MAHYRSLGVTVKRLLTDNGSAYRSKAFKATCKALGITHYTRPYSVDQRQAERFIRPACAEWAYGRVWNKAPSARLGCRPSWPTTTRRPHSALGQWEEPCNLTASAATNHARRVGHQRGDAKVHGTILSL